jgi:MCM AAA-lid domain
MLDANSMFHIPATHCCVLHTLCVIDNCRSKQDSKTLPVTPRCLETIIRLSTAHAKARLSPTVEETDCQKVTAQPLLI